MNQIQIVSWLLTRRCNLKCSYCRISRPHTTKPSEYPDFDHYLKNEMKLSHILMTLDMLKQHNPDIFIIWYGGEPFLRNDLPEIIGHCNSENINYTIISNNTDVILPKVTYLMENHKVKGFTVSVDPYKTADEGDRFLKSSEGLKNLLFLMKEYQIDDPVVEITVDRNTIGNLIHLIERLSQYNITSDVTVLDVAKSDYYDFSNVVGNQHLLEQNIETAKVLQEIVKRDDLLVHMKNTLVPEIFNIIPSKLNCGIEHDLHNLTIDADGSIRLCLRIRGVEAPKFNIVENIYEGEISYPVLEAVSKDKKTLCKGCNWTCMKMSSMIRDHGEYLDSLVHTDRR